MTNKKIIVIGCGAGGGTSAQFARKTNRKYQVHIYEKGPYPQYSKCGLPYAISGVIEKPIDLTEFSEEWFSKAKIDLFLNTNISKIDTKGKKVHGLNNQNETIEDSYDSLIIATGCHPVVPPIKHIFHEKKLVDGVFTIRTISDANDVIDHLSNTENVTIVGAGLIGLEMADCLIKKEKQVTVVEALPHILPMIDDDISKSVEQLLRDHITLFTNHFATEINTDQNGIKEVIITNKDTTEKHIIPTDMLIIAAGTAPEVTLAEEAGCLIGETGGIVVDSHAKTSISDIYAVGDCTEYVDFVSKKPVPIGLGSIAVRQGIAAGINAAGGTYVMPKGVLQTFTSDFFNMQIAGVGPSSLHLDQFETVSGKHAGSSLPEYFPGGKPIQLKTNIDVKTGKILSAQAVGENAAQRINTYATAILSGMTIEEFRKLETAYAPPVAPTLDVVTIAADIGSKKRQRKMNR